MRKISLLTLISAMGISSLTYADNFYTDIRYANTGHTPEYQIEHAKEDFIFEEGYTDYKNLEDKFTTYIDTNNPWNEMYVYILKLIEIARKKCFVLENLKTTKLNSDYEFIPNLSFIETGVIEEI